MKKLLCALAVLCLLCACCCGALAFEFPDIHIPDSAAEFYDTFPEDYVRISVRSNGNNFYWLSFSDDPDFVYAVGWDIAVHVVDRAATVDGRGRSRQVDGWIVIKDNVAVLYDRGGIPVTLTVVQPDYDAFHLDPRLLFPNRE